LEAVTEKKEEKGLRNCTRKKKDPGGGGTVKHIDNANAAIGKKKYDEAPRRRKEYKKMQTEQFGDGKGSSVASQLTKGGVVLKKGQKGRSPGTLKKKNQTTA